MHLAHTENDSVRPDPTIDHLRQLVAGLGPGNNYLIYESHPGLIAVPDTAHYIQTYRHVDQGYFDVEYRTGTPEHHYATTMASVEEVVAALSRWASHEMHRIHDYTWTTPFASSR